MKKGKIQKAFDYREKGKKIAWIAKKLEISEHTVRAYIWRVKNPEKYKALLQRYLANRKAKKEAARAEAKKAEKAQKRKSRKSSKTQTK